MDLVKRIRVINEEGETVDAPIDYKSLANLPTFKTVNGQTITGTGNIVVAGGGEGSGGASVELDSTLTQSGKAADAKAVGDAVNAIPKQFKTINGESVAGSGNISTIFDNMIPQPVSDDYYNGKTIACIGDSITYGVGASNNANRYASRLAQMLGMTEINLGVSGTVLCTGGHRTCNISQLTSDKIGNANIVTILMGVNDWDQAKNEYYDLGELGSSDTTTIYGAVKMWCEKVMEIKALPQHAETKFYFATPIITSWNNSVSTAQNWDQEKKNIHGFKLRDLCMAIIETCAMYKIPVFDTNKYSGIYYNSPEDNTVGTYFGDGIHPNDAGHNKLAESMRDYILSNPTYVAGEKAINYLLGLFGNEHHLTYPETPDIDVEITEPPVQEKILQSITVTTPPNTTVYKTGDTFNKTGMVITASYSDGSIEVVSNYTITDGSNLSLGKTSVTISYTEGTVTKTTTQAITVNAPTKTLTSIAVTTNPSKMQYTEGETFSADGMVVTAYYSDGSNEAVGGYMWSPNGALSTDNTVITISYQGKTATINITVKESEPVGYPVVLGTNARFDAASSVFNGTVTDNTVSMLNGYGANAAILNVPIKKGDEVEVKVYTSTGSYCNQNNPEWTATLMGFTTANAISNIPMDGQYHICTGSYNVYTDQGNWPEITFIYPTGNAGIFKKPTPTVGQYYFERDVLKEYTFIIKRGEDGKCSSYVNGTLIPNPSDLESSYPEYTNSFSVDEMYFFVDGLTRDTLCKVNYVGEARN